MFSSRSGPGVTRVNAAGRVLGALALGALVLNGSDAPLGALSGSPLLVLQAAPNSPVLNSIGFGNIAIGANVNKTVTLSNGGGGTLTFSSITISGANAADYALSSSSCGSAALATGSVCTVTVGFHPSAAGKRDARLNFVDSGLGSPHIIPLSGFGLDGAAPQKAAGPVDLRIGYPAFYKDQNGLALAPCVDDAVMCLTPVPDLTRPPSVTGDPATTNFNDEFFYYDVEATFPDLPGKSLVRLVLEGAFNTPELIPGEQIVFGRVRIRIQGLKAGVTYRITHPYGHDDLTAEADATINFTDDFGSFSSPSDFAEVLNARIFPFLTWAPLSAAPAGFIGDPNVPHVITPGPAGNFIRIEELSAGGQVVARIDETNLFTVSGRVANGAVAPQTPNQAPIAGDDTASVVAPNAVTIRALDNDIDPDGDPIQMTAVGAAAHGTTSINNNGAFITYTPDPAFNGVDTFTYDIDDFRGGTATATVTVTVSGGGATTNNPPVAVDDAVSTQPGQPVIVGVLLNDSDPDSDPISVVSATAGSRGTTTVNSGLTVTYTPNTAFTSGSDTFVYTISDGKGGTASAVVTVTVVPPPPNRAPIANADTATTRVSVPVNIDVLGGTTAGSVADTDPDGDPLVVTGVAGFVNGAAGIQLDGTVTFTPTAGFTGTGSFTYTIADGRGGSATGNVTVTVLGPTRTALVSSDGTGARTTPAFSTTGATVLVAFAASDGPTTGTNNQVLTITGAGLAWTRVAHAITSRGVSDIWTATAPAALTNVTVTSTQSVTTVLGLPVNQSLTVAAFANASGVGAVNIRSAASGAPSVSLVTTSDGSLVYGVGNDFDQAIARTVGTGQTKVHEFLAPSGDTMWVQARSTPAGVAGTTVTLNDTAPTADQWNFAIVEIKK
jgi:hypothetical protein